MKSYIDFTTEIKIQFGTIQI